MGLLFFKTNYVKIWRQKMKRPGIARRSKSKKIEEVAPVKIPKKKVIKKPFKSASKKNEVTDGS